MNGATTTARWGWVLLILAGSPAGGVLTDRDQGTSGPSILKMETGARAAGMAGTFVGIADDASGYFWNPACLNQTERQEFLLSHSQEFGDQRYSAAAYTRPFWKGHRRRTLGVGLATLSYGSFDVLTRGETTNRANPYEAVAGVSYTQSAGPLWVGGALKGITQSLSQSNSQSAALDLGLFSTAFRDRFRWGVSLTNLGPPLHYENQQVRLPTLIRGGAGWAIPLGVRGPKNNQILLAAQLDIPNDEKLDFRMGFEYKNRNPTLETALRAGYAPSSAEGWQGVTLGFGLGIRSVSVNYAYLFRDQTEASQRIDFVFRFGNRLVQEVREESLFAQAQKEILSGLNIQAQDTLKELLVLSPHHQAGIAMAKEMEDRVTESIDPDTLFFQGHHAFGNKDYDRAVDFFRKLLLVKPDHAEGRVWLDKAEKEAQSARGKKLEIELARGREKQRKVEMAKAESLMRERAWAAALAAWQNALALGGDKTILTANIDRCRENLLRQGEAAETAGRWEEALTCYRALSANGYSRDSEKRVRAIEMKQKEERTALAKEKYRQGMTSYGEGHLDAARQLFEETLQLNPGDKNAEQALSQVLGELRLRSTKP